MINSKSFFHENSQQFGYEICPSYVIHAIDEIPLVVDKLKKFDQGVWVKYDGSGGDTNIRLSELTRQSLETAIVKIAEIITQTFFHGSFSNQEKNDLIEPGSTIPRSGIVVEADVTNFGKIIVNGSRTVYTDKAGTVKILEHASQITRNGVFIGSKNLDDDINFISFLNRKKLKTSTIFEKIDEDAKSISKLTELAGYFGIHGQDFFMIETPKGEIKIFNTELNARITNTGVAIFAAKQAGIDHFLTLDLESRNGGCNTLEDFENMVTVNGVNYLNNNPQLGAVWPMAFGARWSRNPQGNYSLEKRSSGVRVVLLAQNGKIINNIEAALSSRWKIA